MHKNIFQSVLSVFIALGIHIGSLAYQVPADLSLAETTQAQKTLNIGQKNKLLDEFYGFQINNYSYDY